MTTSTPSPAPRPASEASIGELLSRVPAQTSQLVRDEIRLAQAELTQKGKRAGIGVGLFGGAGLFSIYGVGALVAAAILGLSEAVDGWLAALIVAVVLFVIAGIAALIGKNEVQQAVPPVPQEAVASVKTDIETIKPGASA
ncbi:phage holin family protein [uncultured Jatrophihabitans sp.]|uniref:phage holin family protein n=1 Tax=uncultured Jatrophihabitans sp. TaxID=1610747 RepID=UPI0035CC2E09